MFSVSAFDLTTWLLDLNQGTILLTVSSTGSISFGSNGVDCTKFSFINARSNNPSSVYRLTDCADAQSPAPGLVSISIIESDLNYIKLDYDLATVTSNSYLQIDAGTNIFDSASDTLRTYSSTQAVQASSVIPDSIPPAVSTNGFRSFDLDSGDFTINFTEPVDVSSIKLPGTLFFEHFAYIEMPSDIFEVQSNICPSPTCTNGTLVSFRLSTEDLNRLKLNRRVCTSGADCWLTINGTFIEDMSGNGIQRLPDGVRTDMRFVVSYTDDTTGPVLTHFTLNMSTQLLSLTFDEPVDISTFNLSGITLQSSTSVFKDQISMYYTLTGGTVLSNSGTIIDIELSSSDAVEIQSRPNLATSLDNTHLSLSSATVRDVSYLANQVQFISMSSAKAATKFQPDTAPPRIISFSLDLDSNSLTLTFSEAVLVNSINLTGIQLLSSPAGEIIHTLQGVVYILLYWKPLLS